jgi:hypothetical protein
MTSYDVRSKSWLIYYAEFRFNFFFLFRIKFFKFANCHQQTTQSQIISCINEDLQKQCGQTLVVMNCITTKYICYQYQAIQSLHLLDVDKRNTGLNANR